MAEIIEIVGDSEACTIQKGQEMTGAQLSVAVLTALYLLKKAKPSSSIISTQEVSDQLHKGVPWKEEGNGSSVTIKMVATCGEIRGAFSNICPVTPLMGGIQLHNKFRGSLIVKNCGIPDLVGK